jgi:hypothetical protein
MKRGCSYLRDLADRTDVILGVSDALHEYSLGILINGRRECLGSSDVTNLTPIPNFLKSTAHAVSSEFACYHSQDGYPPLNWLYV